MEECLQFYDVQQANKTLFFRKDGIILALDREEILYSESIQHIMYIIQQRKTRYQYLI